MAIEKPKIRRRICIVFETDISSELLEKRFLWRRTKISHLLPLGENKWVAILDTNNPVIANQKEAEIKEYIAKHRQTQIRRGHQGL